MKKHLTLFITLVVLTTLGASAGYTQNPVKLKKTKENRLERLKQEFMMYQNPTTQKIPMNVREKELSYIYSSKAHLQPAFSKNARATATTFNIRGPFNVGGRTRAIGVDARNTNIIMIGGASGGLYRSTDGGSSWTIVSSASANPSITGIAQDPTSQDTWYYITGESIGTVATNVRGATYLGDGVFKSTDNGATWTQLSSTKPANIVSFGLGTRAEWQFCHDIAIDPIDGAVLVANFRGIYRSTNGGTSWTRVLDAAMSTTTDMTHIDVLKTGTTTRVYYVGTHSSGTKKGFFTSTNGTTWNQIASPASMPTSWERIEVAIAPSNANIVWFFVSNQAKQYRLYKYNATGSSWADRSGNLPDLGGDVGNLDTQGSYNMVMAVKPNDENYIFIAGTSLYRSSDGFVSAVNTNNTGNSRWIGGYSPDNDISRYQNHHPDVHSFLFVPGSNLEVLCGHDGGVSKTTDVTANNGTPAGLSKPHPVTWSELNKGYYTTQAYSVAIDPTTSGDKRMLLGFQDNGNWSVNSTSATVNWGEEVGGGDGSYGAIVAGQNIRYISTQNGAVARVTGTNISNPTTAHHVHPSAASNQLFINPFILDKNDQKIMYYPAGTKLWRHNTVNTISKGFNFNGITDAGWTDLTSATITSGRISAIAGSKTTANVVYYGTTDGQVYKLTNANTGATPGRTDIYTGKGLPAGGYVSCIAVDEEDANKVFVTFSNYQQKSIFYSTNGGGTWTDVGGNLEQNADGSGDGPSIRWVAILKLSGSKVYYIGASTGLYSTSTLNGSSTSWTQESTSVIGNVPVGMIQTREVDGLVAVATHGKGSFSANVTSTGGGAAPTVTTLSPANNATNVATNTNLVLTFSENIVKGTGNIVIKKNSDDSVIETIDVTGSAVTISNTVATINPGSDLATGTQFYVEIGATAFKNTGGSAYAGITGKTAWTFTTATTATTAPLVSTYIPANNGANTNPVTNLVLTFDKNVAKGTGNIVIKKNSDNSVVETIDVTSTQVTVSNATVTIDPRNDLATGTQFYVEIAATAFKDAGGNTYAGIIGKTTWTFTTSGTAVGISNVLQRALKVFPNPTTRAVSIRLEKLNVELAKAELYNLSGKLVAEKLLKPVSGSDLEGGLDVSRMAKGTYVLKIITAQHIISRVLVVQ